MRTIRLIWVPAYWLAEFCQDGKPDELVSDVFGTHVVRTAFSGDMSKEMVSQAMQAMNPEYIVS